jgi:hypothetical protein
MLEPRVRLSISLLLAEAAGAVTRAAVAEPAVCVSEPQRLFLTRILSSWGQVGRALLKAELRVIEGQTGVLRLRFLCLRLEVVAVEPPAVAEAMLRFAKVLLEVQAAAVVATTVQRRSEGQVPPAKATTEAVTAEPPLRFRAAEVVARGRWGLPVAVRSLDRAAQV